MQPFVDGALEETTEILGVPPLHLGGLAGVIQFLAPIRADRFKQSLTCAGVSRIGDDE